MGRLTTHVLDTARGQPAAGITLRLYYLDGDQRQLTRTCVTNDDGRTSEPLLQGAEFRPGQWEIVFEVGEYFAGLTTGAPAFLSDVPVRFSLQPDEHYHVPLLVSPWSYSTYRGS